MSPYYPFYRFSGPGAGDGLGNPRAFFFSRFQLCELSVFIEFCVTEWKSAVLRMHLVSYGRVAFIDTGKYNANSANKIFVDLAGIYISVWPANIFTHNFTKILVVCNATHSCLFVMVINNLAPM